jgi:hypothetical protein
VHALLDQQAGAVAEGPHQPSRREATQLASTPNRRASSWLRSSSANTTIAATSPAIPATAATTRPPDAPLQGDQRQRQDRQAELGEAVPHPETSTATVVRDREYPHDPSIM